jgi:hypothetical protein
MCGILLPFSTIFHIAIIFVFLQLQLYTEKRWHLGASEGNEPLAPIDENTLHPRLTSPVLKLAGVQGTWTAARRSP